MPQWGFSDAVLNELKHGKIQADAFAGVLHEFGELPEKGQRELARRLFITKFRRLVAIDMPMPTSFSLQKQYKRIAKTAKTLALLLRDVHHDIPSDSEILSVLVTVPPWDAMRKDDRVESFISSLSTIEEEAKRLANRHREMFEKTKSSKGAYNRREKTVEGQTISNLIDAYAELRNRKVGWSDGGPLERFLLAGLRAVAPESKLINPDPNDSDAPDTTTQLRGAFNRWKKGARSKLTAA